MGSTYFTNPIIFLVRIIFEFYLLVIMLRFILQWIRADFYNPVSQFIVKITNPLIIPLRKIIPGIAGLDLASLVLMISVAILQILVISMLSGFVPSMAMLISRGMVDLITLFLNIYFFTIIIQVVLSWIAPHQYNPIIALIHQLNEPLLRPIRKLLPASAGIDFSPLLAIILIQLSKMILIPPLLQFH